MALSYRRSRREAVVAALIWFLAGIWTISVSYWLGYTRPVRSLGGIPNWVFWGVFLPWVVFFLIHTWYSLIYMRDEDGESPPD